MIGTHSGTSLICHFYSTHLKNRGKVLFQFFVSPHPGGGAVLPWLGGGVTLVRGYLPWLGVLTLAGGTYPGQGVPTLNEGSTYSGWGGGEPGQGVPTLDGVPILDGEGVPTLGQSSIMSTGCAMGGMPLVFTQMDFLIDCVIMAINKQQSLFINDQDSSVAGPEFPRREEAGRQPQRGGHQPIIWPNFTQNLHENERNWTQGACVPDAPSFCFNF